MAIRKFAVNLSIAMAWVFAATASASNHESTIAQSKAYTTPFSNMVLVKWLLDDERTWCHVYMRRDLYEEARRNNWVLPADAEIGQITCQQNRR